MDFPTLPYLYVTISFHLEICFWGQTHPTISDDVTNFTLFFLKASLTFIYDTKTDEFPSCKLNCGFFFPSDII